MINHPLVVRGGNLDVELYQLLDLLLCDLVALLLERPVLLCGVLGLVVHLVKVTHVVVWHHRL